MSHLNPKSDYVYHLTELLLQLVTSLLSHLLLDGRDVRNKFFKFCLVLQKKTLIQFRMSWFGSV